ncbi:hypothetical protein BD413DRAFT_117857 [Trametes elegans]|nr:hypothetical protein BD413DRAFT_117857 [Trametes elegans]
MGGTPMVVDTTTPVPTNNIKAPSAVPQWQQPTTIVKYRDSGITKCKRKVREYTFLEDTDRRKKEHSRMGINIENQCRLLDSKTAPFILLYISRPESVDHGQGGVHWYMSPNLTEMLGEDFLTNVHRQVVCATSKRKGENISRAININFEVERKRQQRAELELATLQEEVARLRSQVVAVA